MLKTLYHKLIMKAFLGVVTTVLLGLLLIVNYLEDKDLYKDLQTANLTQPSLDQVWMRIFVQ